MGLDMYLDKHTYVKNWKHTESKDRHSVLVKKGGKVLKDIKSNRVKNVVEEIAYWRKANAIHNYFVDVVRGGEYDNGDDMSVSEEDLKDLLDRCEKVLKASKLVRGKIQNGTSFKNGKSTPIMEDGKYIKDSTVAKELLPCVDGFFFGGTEYNEYYYTDIKNTRDMLVKELKNVGGGDYYYNANW